MRARKGTSVGIVLLFGMTMFLSAALLFDIQPMYAKMLLPLVGGAPSVWNTVVVFFQITLLCGYFLAHIQRSAVPLKAQIPSHIALAGIAIVLLPFRLVPINAAAIGHPVFFVLSTLLVGAGLPFLAISATAPLLQSWFARLGHKHSHDPYFFYATSNAGSLVGLAAYPLLLEPLFGLRLQSALWAIAYCVLVAGLAACGVVTWLLGTHAAEDPDAEQPTQDDRPPAWRQRLRWGALAFVPASLSLAMTTHITNEVAPIPLLWTLPLSIYLLTFIIAFSRRPILTPQKIAPLLPFVILALALLVALGVSGPRGPYAWLAITIDIAFNMIALFLIGLSCHGDLSASRPSARYLTAFYMVLSIGGAFGGLFNAVVAPYVFHTVAEYPISLVLACIVLPTLGVLRGSTKDRVLDFLAPLLLGLVLFGFCATAARGGGFEFLARIALAIAIVVCFSFVRRRIRFALGIAALFIVAALLPTEDGPRIFVDRNFFGAKVVVDNRDQGWHEFTHSGTIHGLEDTAPAKRRIPLAYYSKDGPLNSIFAAARSRRVQQFSVGAVGLGVGTIACYRLPNERWTFFEIDPQVVALARNTKLFWYLSACAPDATIVVGDGRLELSKVPPGTFDLLVLDAYSSDQPPIHMLTTEAFDLFASRVRPDGLLAFHISSRYFNLAPVIANLAASAGWQAWINREGFTKGVGLPGEMPSQWVVAARSPRDAGSIAADPNWQRLNATTAQRTWTDDYSSLLLVMHD